mgnify:CR=1 FL=1
MNEQEEPVHVFGVVETARQVYQQSQVQLERETPSSVELTRNARGEMQWQIKVYCEAGLEGSAALTAVAVDDSLRREYGLPGRQV